MNTDPIPDFSNVEIKLPPVIVWKAKRKVERYLIAVAGFLSSQKRQGMLAAINGLNKLTDDELTWSKAAIATPESVRRGFTLDMVDKITALIESVERVRAKMRAAKPGDPAVQKAETN